MFFISDAYAQGAPAPEGGGYLQIVILLVMVGSVYFLALRPQAKRARELKAMNDALSKGDEVITTGGVVGRITDLSDQYITLQVASVGDKPVALAVQRSAVQTLLPKGTMKSL
jgi:preprotein translocase subunit YajC